MKKYSTHKIVDRKMITTPVAAVTPKITLTEFAV